MNALGGMNKNIILLCFMLVLLVNCQVNKNVQDTTVSLHKPILLKLNLSDIGDEFSEDIVHSVKGNVKSVEFTNYSFSKTDSAFIPTFSTLIDNYRNCIYNIDRNGQVKNRIIFEGDEKVQTQIEMYEIRGISKNEFSIKFSKYQYDGEFKGKPYSQPKYINYYKDKLLVKKYSEFDKNTTLYKYNDLGKTTKVKITNEDNVYKNKNINYEYDSNNRVIEKNYDFKNSPTYKTKTKYVYQKDAHIKINFAYRDNMKTNVDFEYVKFDKFNNIIEKKEYNPLKYDKELLELGNDKIIIDKILLEIKNPTNDWIIYQGKYQYEFDENNNWTTKTIFTNDKQPKYQLKRVIEYY